MPTPGLPFRRSRSRICALLCVLLGMLQASAQTVNWNIASGTFSSAASWNPATVPGAGSIAVFNTAGGFYSVTFSSNATIAGLVCNDEQISFRSNITTPRLLTVTGASTIQDDVNLNKLSLSTATLNIDTGAILTTFGDSAISATSFNINDAAGGQLYVSGGSLTAGFNITGNFSHAIGQNGGIAIVSLTDAVGSIAGTLSLAASGVAGSAGQFRVDGTDGSISIANLNVGTGVVSGQIGQVIVEGGASLLQTGASSTRVGSSTNSVGSFDVQGATFTSGTGSFIVNPTGKVKVESGTFLANADISISGGTFGINVGTFALATGKTLGVLNGGTFRTDVSSFTLGASTIAVNLGGKFITDTRINIPASGQVLLSDAASAGTFGGASLNPSSGNATFQVSSSATTVLTSGLFLGSTASGAGGTGRFEVLSSGSTVLVGDLRIGDRNTATRSGELLVDGAGSNFNHTSGPILLGTTAGSSGSITVSNGASMSSSTSSFDSTLIGATGRLFLNGGSFVANNDITLSAGAMISGTNVGSFNGALNLAPGVDLTAINATITLPSAFAVEGGSVVSIGGSTASLNLLGRLDLGVTTSLGAPRLEVSGAAQFSAQEANLASGAVASDPLLSFSGDSLATIFSAIRIGTGGISGTDANLLVRDGAKLSFPGSVLTLGHASGGFGTLIVENGGTFDATLAPLTLNARGTLEVEAAHFKATNIIDNGGTVLFNSGTLQLTAGTMTVGNSSLLPTLFTLTPAHYLNVTNTNIEGGAVLNLAGGTLRSGSLSGSGLLNWSSGTVELTSSGATISPGSPLGLLLTLDPLKILKINGNVSVGTGGVLELAGGQLVGAGSLSNSGVVLIDQSGYVPFTGNLNNGVFGTIFIGDRSVVSVDSTIVNAGRLDFDGGTARIAGAGSIVNNGGVITGDGYIAIPVQNAGFGEIRGEAGKAIVINSFALTNDARIRLLGGTVEYVQGLTNNPLGRIEGHGVFKAATIANSGTITLSAGLSDFIGTLTNNASGKVIITGGGTATFYNNVTNNAGSEFRVSAGSTAAFLANVTGTTSFTGGGVKIFEANATPGPLITSGTTIVETGSTVTVPVIRESSLIVRGQMIIAPNGSTDATSRLNQLSIEGGVLDLNDNDLVIDYTGSSPILDIRLALASGALISSSANASTTPKFAIGYMENSTGLSSFSGQAVDSTSLLIAYTLRGDANLDGKVNTLDFNELAGAFGQSNRFWADGDFNYDGAVDSVDFNQFAANYGYMTAVGSGPLLGAVVPEPTLGGTILLLGLQAIRRRKV